MTAAKVPASQDGPATSLSSRQPAMARRMPARLGWAAMTTGDGGAGGARGTIPGAARWSLGFTEAHDGTRLMAWLRPVEAGQPSLQPPGAFSEPHPGNG